MVHGQHGRGGARWPLPGLGGLGVVAAVIVVAIGIGQVAGGRACASVVPAAATTMGIAPLSAGLVSVTYRAVADPALPAPVALRVKEGSSRYWLALLAMNRAADRRMPGTGAGRYGFELLPQ